MIMGNYFFSGVASGLKKEGQPDLGLIFSNAPLRASTVFTKNKIKAAPVLVSRSNSKNIIKAVVVNSGNANACNGQEGVADAKKVVSFVAKTLNIPKKSILVCSTGVIGSRLNVSAIENAIPALVRSLSQEGASDFARSIMTTDTFPKIVVKNISINSVKYNILGIAKGSGMIMPNMATMLAFILTDLPVKKTVADPLFKKCVELSFNSITVDGATSTNDTAIFLYPDIQENVKSSSGSLSGKDDFNFNGILTDRDTGYDILKEYLCEVCSDLARLIIEDGEGATKIVQVSVLNAFNENDAKTAAFCVANSNLVKTAIAGEDMNWGRIMAAVGNSRARIKPNVIDIYINGVKIVDNSVASMDITAETEKRLMSMKEIVIKIDLKLGNASFDVLTCDLTKEYVDINAFYRS